MGPYCNISATTGTFVAQGNCYHLHVSEIRGLGTTYLNAFGAFCLFVSFMYVLHESNRNMRLAIAGETNNVITIGWYTKIIDASIVWAIAWGIYKFFSTSNCGSHKNPDETLVWHYFSAAVVRGYSAGFEVFVFIDY